MTGRVSLLAFVVATGAVHYWPRMPGHGIWLIVLAGSVLLSLLVCFVCPESMRRAILIPAWAALAGLILTSARVEHRLADALDPANDNRVSRVVLRVASLVKINPDSRQFEAELISSVPAGVPSRIYVTWPAPGWSGPYGQASTPAHPFPALIPGQVWRMALTLKPPYGSLNPHAFDYESYMFAQGLRATGTVRGTPQYMHDEPWASLPVIAQRARHYVRQAMQKHLDGKRYGPVLLALAIGDQASVQAADWEVFNRTGVTHLVSISGSHITMIAALGGSLAFWLWRRLRLGGRALAERIPAQTVAALIALLVAWLYCLLAGWGVPARRTFLMLTVVAGAYLVRLPLSASRLLSLVAFAVVILDPWALLASGFWLSFGAVYVLTASAGWWGSSMVVARTTYGQRALSFLGTASRLQLGITLGLMPLLALIFHQVSVASPLANAYAIPVISLLVTPLALLLAAAAFIPDAQVIAAGIAWLGHIALEWMMVPTVWLAEFGAASFDAAAAPLGLTLLAMLGLLLAILPYGFPCRHMAWLFMLPALFWRPERPPEGGWKLVALDVGQSSAIMIQTAHHALLFDTGLRASASFDEGARTIVPFLRTQGVKKLNVMVVSHADIDHAGGMRSVLGAVPVDQSYSSFDLRDYLARESRLLGMPGQLPALPGAMSPCEYGMTWQFDGVTFEFLWPLNPGSLGAAMLGKRSTQRNNYGCVLRIRGRYHSALLPGDIGSPQEAFLVDRGMERVDVVLAAHHGSKTSSSIRFVQAAQAAHVVAQAGAWSRYGHPSPEIEQRWKTAGAQFWRTDRHGAITVRSSPEGLSVNNMRESSARYWHAR